MAKYRIDNETGALIFEESETTKIDRLESDLKKEKNLRKQQEKINADLLERVEKLEKAGQK